MGNGKHTIPQDTSAFETPRSLAISVMVSETVKKSNASQVQLMNPTKNIIHW